MGSGRGVRLGRRWWALGGEWWVGVRGGAEGAAGLSVWGRIIRLLALC